MGRLARWIALLFTFTGAYLVTSNNISLFSFGWFISGIATFFWCIFAFQDKDTPRFLMELCFFILCFRGVINFIN